MKKYLAIIAALALVLTACGQTTAADSTPTPTAATEAAAAPAEQPQSIGSGTLRLLTAAADSVCFIRRSTTGKSTTPTRWAVR